MISAVILTKNEEKNIVNCLESIQWVDEILVIDDNSDDRTVKLAKQHKAKVLVRSLESDFSAQRNFGLAKANYEWVLFVDADERVPNELKNEINTLAFTCDRGDKLNGYYIPRIDFMWGKQLKYGEVGNVKLLKLARRNSGIWKGKVHEQWYVNGNIGELENCLIHYPHQTIQEFLQEINKYSDIRAKELYKQGIHIYWPLIILYPKGKFFLNYIIKHGFLDGIPGLIVALMMSFHSFLVRAKLWMLWQK